MKFQDTIKLAFGHSLLAPKPPTKEELEKVKQMGGTQLAERVVEVESFGLFDSNTSNYNTYYPDVTAEDLTPKDEEFIYPVFRSLSEVIVHKELNPVDFGENGALKRSLTLLRGATVNVDHETSVGNALGSVKNTFWEEGYKTKAGIFIPAGINSEFKLDGKSQPKIARGIMMDPPSIHSTSVTVQFLWDKSHTGLSEEEFWSKLGTFDKEGKLIRRVVTDVKRYHEISLVSHGADPYAQKVLQDGHINNPKWADVSYNKAHPGKKPATKYFMFDYKTDLILNTEQPDYTGEDNTIPKETNNNSSQTSTTMNKQFLLALAMVLGLKNTVKNKEVDYTEDTITEDIVQNAVAALPQQIEELSSRPDITEEEVTRLRQVEEQFNALPKDITPLSEFKKTQTEALRAEVQRNLSLIHNGAIPEAMAKIVTGASFETLSALNLQYGAQVEKEFPLSCKECNSTNVGRGSATLDEGGQGAPPKPKKKSVDQMHELITKRRSKDALGMMHDPEPATK